MSATGGIHKQEHHEQGANDLSDEDVFGASPTALAAHIRRVVTAPDYHPPLLPAVAVELVQLSSDPATPMHKVGNLVRSEPLIAAKVLQLAQSAMYSRGAAITSLDDAMARLGLKNLSDLFLQAAMTTRVFRAKGYEEPMDALRKHSVLCAHLSRLVCRRTGFPDEYAYMCGLLHDVGIATGILIFGETKRDQRALKYEDIRPGIEVVHEEASAVLGKAWGLPPDVLLVLGHHHRYVIQGRVHPLAAAVCFADWLASEAGVAAGNEVNGRDGKLAAIELRLSENDVRGLLAEAKTIAAQV
jgi:HD-like signal output (HDOD) protein